MMEAVANLLAEWGYGGLFLAAFIAGSILPLGSEAVMVVLLGVGLDPVWCLLSASVGNTLGGMSCYWIGSLGRTEWIARIGISSRQLARARRFMAGRGALMGFFAFLPAIGEAIAILLGLMHSNPWVTGGSMFVGKLLRYAVVVLSWKGIISMC